MLFGPSWSLRDFAAILFKLHFISMISCLCFLNLKISCILPLLRPGATSQKNPLPPKKQLYDTDRQQTRCPVCKKTEERYYQFELAKRLLDIKARENASVLGVTSYFNS